MDKLTPEQRHYNMSCIRSTGTRPEKLLRSALFRMGYRFRKNDRKLPGSPDIVFPHYHAVIFVNGCFWHGHEGCRNYVVPKTNVTFWQNKIRRNRERDSRDLKLLHDMGWRVGVVWECSISGKNRRQKIEKLAGRLCFWLEEEYYCPLETF